MTPLDSTKGLFRYPALAGTPPRLSKGREELRELATTDREHPVHRRLELELPVLASLAAADLADAAEVDGVVAVGADEAEGLEGREELTQGADVAEQAGASGAHEGLVTGGVQIVNIGGVHGHAAEVGKVQQNTIEAIHGSFLA